MFKPEKFTHMTETVQELVLAIRMRCEELLSENVSRIKELNEGENAALKIFPRASM